MGLFSLALNLFYFLYKEACCFGSFGFLRKFVFQKHCFIQEDMIFLQKHSIRTGLHAQETRVSCACAFLLQRRSFLRRPGYNIILLTVFRLTQLAMDSPEEVTSPLLNASSPDILPEDEKPCTPELDFNDSDDEHINNLTSDDLPFKPIVSPPGYEPPSSPIELPSVSGSKCILHVTVYLTYNLLY